MKRRNFLQTTRQRQYKKKRFGNPDAKKPPMKWRLLLGALIVTLTLFSIPFAFAFAPVFAFQEISIEGLTSISEREVYEIINRHTSEKTLQIFPQNNQFYFPKEAFKEELLNSYELTSLEVVTENRTLTVKLEERIVELVWSVQNEQYFLDLSGLIVERLDEQDQAQISARLADTPQPVFEGEVRILHPTMPIIIDSTRDSVTENEQIVPEGFVDHVINMDIQLRKYGINPIRYERRESFNTSLTVVNKSGPDVLISTEEGIDTQILGLQVILNDYRDRLEELEYIDLRFGDHIFIK